MPGRTGRTGLLLTMVTTLHRPAPEHIATVERPIDRASRGHLARRLVGAAFATAGLAEGVWVALLSFVLPALAEAERWSAAWAVLDTAEALGLFCTGWFLARLDKRCALSASATAVLLLIDAAVDITTSAPGTPRALALVEACLAEVPLAVACDFLALYVVWRQPFNGRHGSRDF